MQAPKTAKVSGRTRGTRSRGRGTAPGSQLRVEVKGEAAGLGGCGRARNAVAIVCPTTPLWARTQRRNERQRDHYQCCDQLARYHLVVVTLQYC